MSISILNRTTNPDCVHHGVRILSREPLPYSLLGQHLACFTIILVFTNIFTDFREKMLLLVEVVQNFEK